MKNTSNHQVPLYRQEFIKAFMVNGNLKTTKDWNQRREKLQGQVTMDELIWLDTSGLIRTMNLVSETHLQ